MTGETRQEYRPRTSFALTILLALLLTSGALVWIGLEVTAENRALMDGWVLLLFTVIPIRPFSWTFAAVFAFLAYRVLKKIRQDAPSLSVTKTGIAISGQEEIPWSSVLSVQVSSNDMLRITIQQEHEAGSTAEPVGWLTRFRRLLVNDAVMLSSFDLGVSAETVAQELQKRLEALQTAANVNQDIDKKNRNSR